VNPNIYTRALWERACCGNAAASEQGCSLPPWASRRLQARSMAPSSPVLQSIHGTADLTAFLLSFSLSKFKRFLRVLSCRFFTSANGD
jgi:hypothetical protein